MLFFSFSITYDVSHDWLYCNNISDVTGQNHVHVANCHLPQIHFLEIL